LRDVIVFPKVIANDVAVAKVNHVIGGVHQAVQESSVNRELLGFVQLLNVQEAVRLCQQFDLNPCSVEL
jgi:hypothetical protein